MQISVLAAILFALAQLANIYVVKRYYQLYPHLLTTIQKRLSLSRLNKTIGNTTDGQTLEKLQRCKKAYITYLILLYVSIILMLVSIFGKLWLSQSHHIK